MQRSATTPTNRTALRAFSARRSNAPLRALCWTLVALLVAPPAALAGPDGAEVVSGTATIVQDGTDTTITTSHRTIIEWQDFDIGVGESVEFKQPTSRSRVLNRVVGPDSTEIEGALRANGHVYILNPYGIFFADTAVVEVAHLVAAAGHMSNEDFLGGVDRFTELGGAIENLGTIEGRTVTLLGASVANHGTITADQGRIWMLAGDEVIVAEHGSPIILKVGTPDESQLAEYAVVNSGNIDAGHRGAVRMAAGDLLSLAIHNSGTVRARDISLAGGEGSRVQVEGTLDASNDVGGPVRDGGTIDVRGDSIFVNGATLDASGRRGGGTIHVGGGVQGALSDEQIANGDRNSQLTYVSEDSTLRADALIANDGGEVVVWSDGAAIVEGHLSARGGERRGDGGFIETSGKEFLSANIAPDLSAPNGQGGHWLIDPADIEIVQVVASGYPADLTEFVENIATAPVVTGAPLIQPEIGGTPSRIAADTLESALAQGFSITLSTALSDGSAGDPADAGNITFVEGLDFDVSNVVVPGTSATLALRAANRIVIESTSGGIDDSLATNLTLNLDFLAGDGGQVQNDDFGFTTPLVNPTAADPNSNESIVIEDAISVRGTATFIGEDVIATGGITGGTVLVQADHAADLGPLRATSGGINAFTNDGDLTVTGVAGSQDAVSTDGGSAALGAFGGDLVINGNIETLDDDDPSIGAALSLIANPIATEDSMPRGGNITTTKLDALDAIQTGGLTFFDAGDSMTIAHDITTKGADAQLRVTDNPTLTDVLDDNGNVLAANAPFITGPQTMTLLGNVTTEGGAITIESTIAADTTPADDSNFTVDFDIQGDLDASDPGGEAPGDVFVQLSGNVDFQNGVDITADDVLISAGRDGTGDVDFLGTHSISARTVVIEAGDGYSREPIDDATPPELDQDVLDYDERVKSAVNGLAGVSIGGNIADSLSGVSIGQDADLSTANLPTIDFTGATDPTSLALLARDGVVHVTAGSLSALGTGTPDILTLIAGGPSATTEAIVLDEQLDFETVDLRVAETLTIDDQANFASRMSGANTDHLFIQSGLASLPDNDPILQPEFVGVGGTLTIGDNITLSANETGAAPLGHERRRRPRPRLQRDAAGQRHRAARRRRPRRHQHRAR